MVAQRYIVITIILWDRPILHSSLFILNFQFALPFRQQDLGCRR